jgi:hypothetical protein
MKFNAPNGNVQRLYLEDSGCCPEVYVVEIIKEDSE